MSINNKVYNIKEWFKIAFFLFKKFSPKIFSEWKPYMAPKLFVKTVFCFKLKSKKKCY